MNMAEELLEPLTPARMNRAGPLPGTVSWRTLAGLDWLNFFLASLQLGVGPFVAVYLTGMGWDERQTGLALATSCIVGLLLQTPAGILVDRAQSKHALIAWACPAVAAGVLLVALWPAFWPVITGLGLVSGVSCVFIPTVCSLSLGAVGHDGFAERQGRNQMLNSAGNVAGALAMGLLAYHFSNRSIFFYVALMCLPTALALQLISPGETDRHAARGADADPHDAGGSARWRGVVASRPLLVFLACGVLFHLSNAAMLPLLGEMLGHGRGRSSMLLMSACIITTQVTMALACPWMGRHTTRHGRKPLLLLGFGALPVRGLLYLMTDDPVLLVAVQVLDGVGAGVFGVVAVLVIADLARGTCCFNLLLSSFTTAAGVGASLSQYVGGAIVHRHGYAAGFLTLSAVGLLAAALLAFCMPETHATGRRSSFAQP